MNKLARVSSFEDVELFGSKSKTLRFVVPNLEENDRDDSASTLTATVTRQSRSRSEAPNLFTESNESQTGIIDNHTDDGDQLNTGIDGVGLLLLLFYFTSFTFFIYSPLLLICWSVVLGR